MRYLQLNKDYRNDAFKVKSATAKHYDSCYWDYLLTWCNRENLAIHYGYWDKQTKSHHQALLNKNQILYALAKISADDYVLDAGCGIGGSAIWMAKHYHNQVAAITISEQQAKYANKHAKHHGVLDKVAFQVADFCSTPFADKSFDVIWGLESVCHALNKDDFLKESYRLLKNGGRIVVCDGYRLRNKFTADEWQDIVTCLNGWAVPNLCSSDEFSQLLAQNNFKNIRYQDITNETLPSAEYMFRLAKYLQPIQKISQWLGLRSKVQTANFKVGLAQYRLFKDKIVEYGIFTATKD